ncbi:hypothetical protein D5S17_14605 [Pseudonocardiaceae bacterium YIM PH 21723]|nr:hypothetical protein D5S17_14605 [Pseudonocardiaceae bacterium YIM PH 21723]
MRRLALGIIDDMYDSLREHERGMRSSQATDAEKSETSRMVLAAVLSRLDYEIAPFKEQWQAEETRNPRAPIAGAYRAFYDAAPELGHFDQETYEEALDWLKSVILILDPDHRFDDEIDWMGEDDLGQYTSVLGGDLSWGTAAAAAVITSALAPFIKTLVTKAAEDSYSAARALVARLFRSGRKAGQRPGGHSKLLIVRDPGKDLGLALHLGTDTPDAALRALGDLDIVALTDDAKRRKVQMISIQWDSTTKTWTTTEK